MSKLLNAYSNYLARKPLQGNVVTAIVSPLSILSCLWFEVLIRIDIPFTFRLILQGLFGVGDGLAQMIEGKPGYDFARTA